MTKQTEPQADAIALDCSVSRRKDSILAKVARLASPGYSTCLRCCFPWSVVENHSTKITQNSGMFPLCEKCWLALSAEERLPYYFELSNDWKTNHGGSPYSDEQIRSAVLSE